MKHRVLSVTLLCACGCAAFGAPHRARAADAINPQSIQHHQHAGVTVHGGNPRIVRPVGRPRTVKPLGSARRSSG